MRVRRWGVGAAAAVAALIVLGQQGAPSADPGSADPSQAVDATASAAGSASAPSTPVTSTPAPSTPAVVSGSAASPTPASTGGSAPAATPPSPSATTGAVPAGAVIPVVRVADGDTLTVRIGGRRERIRIIGIDTPETGECGFEAAREALVRAVAGGVRLEADRTQDDRDRYGRLLRHVVLPDGTLAAQQLIGAGLGREYTYAAAYRHRDAYVAAERTARGRAFGVWSAGCARPVAPTPAGPSNQARPSASDTSAPRGGEAARGASEGCRIKGNINGDGEKIYHVPGGRSYDETRISAGTGERWFCSPEQARAAGWRAARG